MILIINIMIITKTNIISIVQIISIIMFIITIINIISQRGEREVYLIKLKSNLTVLNN